MAVPIWRLFCSLLEVGSFLFADHRLDRCPRPELTEAGRAHRRDYRLRAYPIAQAAEPRRIWKSTTRLRANEMQETLAALMPHPGRKSRWHSLVR